jgi:hypothetical protein
MARHITTILTVCVLGAALLACKKDGASGAKRLDHPGTADGLKALLTTHFASAGAKPADVVTALKPDAADYAAVFDGDAATKVQANTDKMLATPPAELGKPGDEIQVFSVTVDDLKTESEASKGCPGGYTRIAGNLKSGVTLYCTKVGSISYDVFSHVNGHWVWFPKAFRALRD